MTTGELKATQETVTLILSEKGAASTEYMRALTGAPWLWIYTACVELGCEMTGAGLWVLSE